MSKLAENFLKSKGLIDETCTEMEITNNNGTFKLTDLLEEFRNTHPIYESSIQTRPQIPKLEPWEYKATLKNY